MKKIFVMFFLTFFISAVTQDCDVLAIGAQIDANDNAGAVTNIDTVEFEKEPLITLKLGSPIITIGVGELISADIGTAPIIEYGRAYVPIKTFISQIGGTINWDNGKREITISIYQTEIKLWLDKSIISVNEVEQQIDWLPLIINGRAMMPIKYLGKALNYSVNWFDDSNIITLIDPLLKDKKKTDINGDGLDENIFLFRVNNDSELRLIIRDSTNSLVLVDRIFKDLPGIVSPNIFIGDFNLDNINDILISIYTGGSSGNCYYYMYAFKNNKLEEIPLSLFNFTNINNIHYEIIDKNDCRITIDDLKQDFIIPISENHVKLLEENKKQQRENFYIGCIQLSPIACVGENGKYNLKFSCVFGPRYKDYIGFIDIIYTYKNQIWEPISANIENLDVTEKTK